MKYKKTITILVVCIVTLSLFVSILGIFSTGGAGQHEITSFYGNKVSIYGRGLYKNNSVPVASQGIVQGIITMILGIPLLDESIISDSHSINIK